MDLIFLKLGGSLITDKQTPRTSRPETLRRLMAEIAAARAARPDMRLVLGHGSGSFGHVEAARHGTRQGVWNAAGWEGFAEVQHAASLLNRVVVDAAREVGLPVFNCPPSASAMCHDGAVYAMAVEPLQAALEHDLVPLVRGDVAVDVVRGGTVASTESVFRFLARRLHPRRVLLAGIEPGVLNRWPGGEKLPIVTPDILAQVGAAHTADVTGGMRGKVAEMLYLAAELPSAEIRIFSGEAPGQVQQALQGEALGTLVLGQ